jgi:hypothetical protein
MITDDLKIFKEKMMDHGLEIIGYFVLILVSTVNASLLVTNWPLSDDVILSMFLFEGVGIFTFFMLRLANRI